MDELFWLLILATAFFLGSQYILHRGGYYHHTRERYKYRTKEKPRTDGNR